MKRDPSGVLYSRSLTLSSLRATLTSVSRLWFNNNLRCRVRLSRCHGGVCPVCSSIDEMDAKRDTVERGLRRCRDTGRSDLNSFLGRLRNTKYTRTVVLYTVSTRLQVLRVASARGPLLRGAGLHGPARVGCREDASTVDKQSTERGRAPASWLRAAELTSYVPRPLW